MPEFKPELVRMEAFGNPNLAIDNEWPTKEDLQKLHLGKKIKLTRIGFKSLYDNNDDGFPCGIQLDF